MCEIFQSNHIETTEYPINEEIIEINDYYTMKITKMEYKSKLPHFGDYPIITKVTFNISINNSRADIYIITKNNLNNFLLNRKIETKENWEEFILDSNNWSLNKTLVVPNCYILIENTEYPKYYGSNSTGKIIINGEVNVSYYWNSTCLLKNGFYYLLIEILIFIFIIVILEYVQKRKEQFYLDLKYKYYMKEGNVDERVKKAFKNKKHSLSNEAKAFKIDGKHWEILDSTSLYKINCSDLLLEIYHRNIKDNIKFDKIISFYTFLITFLLSILGLIS